MTGADRLRPASWPCAAGDRLEPNHPPQAVRNIFDAGTPCLIAGLTYRSSAVYAS